MDGSESDSYDHRLAYRLSPRIYKWGRNSILRLRNRQERLDVLDEIFVRQIYGKLYLAIKPNSVVLDIGAGMGETAIYFAMNPNVRRVFSYEPIQRTYQEAKRVISASPFRSKITLVNTGVVGSGRVARVNQEYQGHLWTKLSEAEGTKGTRMRLLSLNEILKGKRDVAIKCDCEGYEAEIFKTADLSRVYAIQLEYHNCKETVKRDLISKGFGVTDLDPGRKQGIIFAARK
ncbi:MAG: FkbM family methyltransferase [Candidatus Micrarchaeota archaeon]|nr:FkbM family methyltransferase [Candidatus Micrarchaeota archaeon]